MVRIQSGFSATLSWAARARPISIWKPGGSPALLAKGSELGCAQIPIAPSERIVSSDRAATSWPPRQSAARGSRGRIAFIAISRVRWAGRSSPLIGFQLADIFDDRLDLRVVEDLAEGRHGAALAGLDALAEIVVAALRVHQLRPLAGRPPAIGMTPAAGRGEDLVDVERRVARRRLVRGVAGLLRWSGHRGD